jgi:predicted anti-sigma-YlaC factor YlaD
MTCDERQMQLSRILDGESAEPGPAGLFAHLEGCADCRQFLDALLRFRADARRDREEILRAADEALPERLPLPTGPAPRRAPTPRGTAWWRPALPLPAAVGLAVLLFVAGVTAGVGLSGRLGPSRSAPTYVYVCSLPQVDVVGSPLPAPVQ